MSFSADPPDSKSGIQDDTDVNVDGKESNRDTEQIIQKCENLFSNIDSGFITIVKDLMKKYGFPLIDHLKVLLECPICKGLITTAVSRKCLHTFCSDCLTQWTVRSKECPICRHENRLHTKNPAIDKVLKLLVDISLTKMEKEERSKEIQQLSPNHALFETTVENLQGEAIVLKINPDASISGRVICSMMARSVLSELMDNFKLDINEQSSIPDILLELHLDMLYSDLESLCLLYRSIPVSALRASFYIL